MASLHAGSPEELANLGLLIDRLPMGVILVTPPFLEVKYANAAAQRIVHPAKLSTGRPLPEPWESFSLSHYAGELVKRGIAPELRVELDDNRVVLVDGVSSRNENRVALMLRDVTRHNRRGRAEREFITNASHELLTPLTGIVAAAHVLEAGGKNVPEDRDRFISHIATECNRLARIARSLLVLARAQSGEEPPRLEIVALRPLLDEIVEQIEADVEVRCSAEVMVFADVDLLIQALTNLVANAVRHGGDGDVVVEAQDLGVNLVELDVFAGDRGEGEAADFRRRFHSAGGRDGGGFGLGLSIAEQSLEVMGGHLLLDGARVRVQIPRGGVRA